MSLPQFSFSACSHAIVPDKTVCQYGSTVTLTARALQYAQNGSRWSGCLSKFTHVRRRAAALSRLNCVLDKFERVRIQWNILKRTLRSMRQNYKMQRRNTLEIIAIANKLTAVQGPYAADLENVLPLPHTPYSPSPPPTPHPAPIKGEKIK